MSSNLEQDVYDLKDAVAKFGSRRAVQKLVDEEALRKVARGLYSSVSNPVSEVLMILSKYYPDAVIAGPSALYFHDLGELMQDKIEVNISRETSAHENPLFDFKRVSPRYMTGIITQTKNGVSYKIYSRERSLFEAARYSPSMLSFAVKAYVKDEVNFDEISRLEAIFGGEVYKLVQHETNDSSI